MEVKVGQALDLDSAMRLAIAEAYKGATKVSPNPLVGCVVLDAHGGFLSKGYHQVYGGPHAEVNALVGLSPEQLRGAHVIVTLEPCAHEGKTPSCAKALARLPLARVTFGLVDPNPLVAGQGAEIIRAAGIAVDVIPTEKSDLVEELEQVAEVFLWNFRRKKPFVALKLASSLDGQIALKSGESRWITGAESREHVHYLRACYDAVLVGRSTVAHDDPALNIRHPIEQKKNKVVVLDSQGALLKSYQNLQLSKVHAPENVYWCVAKDQEERLQQLYPSGPQIVGVQVDSRGGLDLTDILDRLYALGFRSIFVEGGGLVASRFLTDSKVNRLYLFQAPVIIGSGGGQGWTSTLSLKSMKDRLLLKSAKTQAFGADVLWTGRLQV